MLHLYFNQGYSRLMIRFCGSIGRSIKSVLVDHQQECAITLLTQQQSNVL